MKLLSIDTSTADSDTLLITSTGEIKKRQLNTNCFTSDILLTNQTEATINQDWLFTASVRESNTSLTASSVTAPTVDVDGSTNIFTITAPSTVTGTLTLTLPDASVFSGTMNIIIINQNETGAEITIGSSGGDVLTVNGTAYSRTPLSRDIITAISNGTDWYITMVNNLTL